MQGFRRIIDLLAEGHPVELVEQRLVEPLADAIGATFALITLRSVIVMTVTPVARPGRCAPHWLRAPASCPTNSYRPSDRVKTCTTVHKHRNLLAHAPERLHEEISADYNDMIYASTPNEIETRRSSFIRKWRLKCRAVADSLEEAGGRLFTFSRLPDGQWRSARTTNAIERLHEEFKRRIKTQTVLPSAETAAMLFWALLASGQITMRKVDGWQTLAEKPTVQCIDLAA